MCGLSTLPLLFWLLYCLSFARQYKPFPEWLKISQVIITVTEKKINFQSYKKNVQAEINM